MDISKLTKHIDEIMETKKRLETARDMGFITQEQVDEALTELMKKYNI